MPILSGSSLNAGSHIRVLRGALNKVFNDGIATNRAAKPTVVEKITDYTQLVEDGALTLRGFNETMDIYVRSSFGEKIVLFHQVKHMKNNGP